MQAIILAGGKGTRLQSVVSDVPKPMAPVGIEPFLAYQIRYLIKEGIKDIILSVGYKHQSIVDYFGSEFEGSKIQYAIEAEPLGTGGGIRLAVEMAISQQVLVVNGDTFFEFDLKKIICVHEARKSQFSMATHQIQNNGRYGGVVSNEFGNIIQFTPKNQIGESEINAGVYLIERDFYLINTPENKPFSIEDDFFAVQTSEQKLSTVPFVGKKFLDIGIPEDYSAAQKLIPVWLNEQRAEVKLAIFDRDGVLNKKIDNGYVLSVSDLEFLEGVFDTLASFKTKNIPCVVATNQRCIGRGQLTEQKLIEIHQFLSNQVTENQGKINHFFYATGLDETDFDRKPNPGMLLKALEMFEIENPENVIFFGDSISDLQAGKKAGVKTVFLTNTKGITHQACQLADEIFESLNDYNSFVN